MFKIIGSGGTDGVAAVGQFPEHMYQPSFWKSFDYLITEKHQVWCNLDLIKCGWVILLKSGRIVVHHCTHKLVSWQETNSLSKIMSLLMNQFTLIVQKSRSCAPFDILHLPEGSTLAQWIMSLSHANILQTCKTCVWQIGLGSLVRGRMHFLAQYVKNQNKSCKFMCFTVLIH